MKSELDFADFLTISWFIIDAFTHMTIEAGYVYLGLTVTAAKSDSFMGFIWREYGRADKRYSKVNALLHSDCSVQMVRERSHCNSPGQ
jgi:hypothetical protein